MHFIGCLSDDPNNNYMWDNYGKEGVCIEFDVSDMNVHKVTYSNEPLKPKYLREKIRIICEIAKHEKSSVVKEKFTDYLKLCGAIGLLNLYRKDEKFRVESEWRLLTRRDTLDSENRSKFEKAKILRVISDLPPKEDAELQKYCKNKDIKYEHRKH